jgi:hypothetical protein
LEIDAKLLEQFFLRAAAQTYASGQKAYLRAPLPGARMYIVDEEPLLYRDIYRVNGEFSAGWTTIELEGAVVWSMYYHGWCQHEGREETINFLKASLRQSYRGGEFLGGRGPRYRFEDLPDDSPYLEYFNGPSGDFLAFFGRESIERREDKPGTEELLFWHEYVGMLLAPRPARGENTPEAA